MVYRLTVPTVLKILFGKERKKIPMLVYHSHEELTAQFLFLRFSSWKV